MTIDSIALKNRKKEFYDAVIGDIEKASAGGAKMGAFILITCAFNYLAGFYAGKEAHGFEYKKFIEDFVTKYEPRYNPSDIWKSLRCGLVHNYSIKNGKFAFIDKSPELHLKPNIHDKTKLCLNLENFLADFKKATNEYFNRAETDETLELKFKQYLKTVGSIRQRQILLVAPALTTNNGTPHPHKR